MPIDANGTSGNLSNCANSRSRHALCGATRWSRKRKIVNTTNIRLVSMDCGRCYSGPFFTSGTVGLIASSLFHSRA